MKTAIIYLACSVAVLVVLFALYTAEDIKGKRLFLSGFRNMLDTFCRFVVRQFSRAGSYFSNSLVRLLLHYSAHSILKRLLAFLRLIEAHVEELLRQNRKVAKDITTQKKTPTHLDAIAEHKEETALTESQKRKMRAH